LDGALITGSAKGTNLARATLYDARIESDLSAALGLTSDQLRGARASESALFPESVERPPPA
jgi:hypothetical protein